jgi:hypothetical protein
MLSRWHDQAPLIIVSVVVLCGFPAWVVLSNWLFPEFLLGVLRLFELALESAVRHRFRDLTALPRTSDVHP